MVLCNAVNALEDRPRDLLLLTPHPHPTHGQGNVAGCCSGITHLVRRFIPRALIPSCCCLILWNGEENLSFNITRNLFSA